MNANTTTVLPAALVKPSSVFYHNDRVYIGGQTAPAWLVSLRASDLGDAKLIRFPVENNSNSGQPKFNVILKMQWLGDELMVLFSGSSHLTIAAVNPTAWTWREVISTTKGNDILSFWTDGKIIYASGYGQDHTLYHGVISLVSPSGEYLGEWLVPNIGNQYAPALGAGRHLYYVNDDSTQNGCIKVAKFALGGDGTPKIVPTPGFPFQYSGPDMAEYGDYIYMTFMQSFYGYRSGVPDKLLRFNKQTQLVEWLPIDGPARGPLKGLCVASSRLWLTRPGTISSYDGVTFTHFNCGDDRWELLVSDGAGHLFGVERSSPIVVRRYTIPTAAPVPALIVRSSADSIVFGDGQGNEWLVAATKQ